MLSDEQLDELQKRHRKVARVLWDGHEMVFRLPTVTEYEAYQRQRQDAQTGFAALRLFSQTVLVHYDGETALPQARIAYTNGILVDNPGFPNSPECASALMFLAGTAQEEELAHLGKVVTVRSSRTRSMRAGSQNGSPTAPEGPSSPTTAGPLPSTQPSS